MVLIFGLARIANLLKVSVEFPSPCGDYGSYQPH